MICAFLDKGWDFSRGLIFDLESVTQMANGFILKSKNSEYWESPKREIDLYVYKASFYPKQGICIRIGVKYCKDGKYFVFAMQLVDLFSF